ncbi:MAG: MFS transporter [Anaerolineae bacterium]|nr:MFS transporter [Anaerolineae bacterium]MDW8293073.1 MFS transporter [Anaerolineae bacterium]
MNRSLSRSRAARFVVLLGVVSLFADMTYEGARSVSGPFLSALGASATAVGAIVGAGELAGYALRLVAGVLADRTRRYWLLTFVGYTVNLLAVPLLALAGRWEVAAALLLVERVGKALRTPARDAMLSHATHLTGRGWGFGLHEALDQVGAVAGPLLVAAIVASQQTYREAFLALAVPAALALSALATARWLYPKPSALEPAAASLQGKQLPRAFWFYLLAAALAGAGFADFPLAAFHFERAALFSPATIALLYALAMATDAVAALVFGRLFDRWGQPVLAVASAVGAISAPLVFSGAAALSVAGVVAWGVCMGAYESVLRAAVASFAPPEARGAAYGVFNAGFGVAWFLGSAAMGALYDRSVLGMVIFSALLQALAAVAMLRTSRSAD